MIRLYTFQQGAKSPTPFNSAVNQPECAYAEFGSTWGKTYKKGKTINYSNCDCPSSEIECTSKKTCSNNTNIKCSSKRPGSCTEGACVTNCCLRWGQTRSKSQPTYDDIITELSGLINWPTFKLSKGTIHYPLGTMVKIKTTNYIIDQAFDWGSGKRIHNTDLLQSITTSIIDVKSVPHGSLGTFCKTLTICH